MPAASYNDYASVLLELPATAQQIAERLGMNGGCTARLLRQFWALKLCHPAGATPAQQCTNRMAIWELGDGPTHPGLRTRKPGKPKPNQIAFATIWRTLQDGATAHDIGEENGVSHVSVYRLLRLLREHKKVHISGWGFDLVNRPVAIWTFGEGRNERKPSKTTSQKSRDYRARLRHKALTFMGAAA